jgi:hypothetical protein
MGGRVAERLRRRNGLTRDRACNVHSLCFGDDRKIAARVGGQFHHAVGVGADLDLMPTVVVRNPVVALDVRSGDAARRINDPRAARSDRWACFQTRRRARQYLRLVLLGISVHT